MDPDAQFLTGLAVTGLGLLAGHWMPTPKRLHQTVNYIIGVGLILVGIGIWLLPAGNWQMFVKIAAFAAVGGIATLGGYAWDSICNLYQRVKVNDGRRND